MLNIRAKPPAPNDNKGHTAKQHKKNKAHDEARTEAQIAKKKAKNKKGVPVWRHRRSWYIVGITIPSIPVSRLNWKGKLNYADSKLRNF